MQAHAPMQHSLIVAEKEFPKDTFNSFQIEEAINEILKDDN